MNQTKWDRLFQSLEPIRQHLNFKHKDLRRVWVDGITWNSDIHECFGLEEEIEWLELKVIDNNFEHSLLLQKIQESGSPCEATNQGFKIWGYLRSGVNPGWLSNRSHM